MEEESVAVDREQCQQPRGTEQQEDSKGAAQARAGGRECVSPAMTPALHAHTRPVPGACQYSHRAFLLEALPLGSAGGSG